MTDAIRITKRRTSTLLTRSASRLTLLAACLVFCGCATITRGTKESYAIETTPPLEGGRNE